MLVFGRRSDGIAPFRLITIFGCQAYVNVLTCQMSTPIWHIEDEALDRSCFLPNFEHGRELPFELLSHFQSPLSPSMLSSMSPSIAFVALFFPGITIVVITMGFPEAKLVFGE